jgi:DNA-binding PadR family transcriptional regulator
MNDREIQKFLPLSEATYYIMLSLVEPLHGYGVMQNVENISLQTVTVGPGTLYGAFTTLEKAGLICMVREEDRRKYYQLTEKGRLILGEQIRRLQIMAKNGNSIRAKLEK